MGRRSCGDPGPELGGAAYVVVKHRANALLGQQCGHAEDCLRVHRTAQVRERPPDVQLDRLRRQVDGGRWFEFQDQRRCRASCAAVNRSDTSAAAPSDACVQRSRVPPRLSLPSKP